MARYELLERIGVGGVAEIFRGKAVAAGGFEKPVAIKRILPQLSQDRRFVELLIAEARILSLLRHRNIVQIFDVGLGDDDQYFLVMEYVDGKDLRAVQRGLEARRQRLPLDLALHVGAEICEALAHAHAARDPDGTPMSLVHRDVAPSNVLLSRAGEIKLTDFGIAKRAEQETQHAGVRGRFAYIAPEQARNEPVEPRSDVFAVGVVLWELLCNRRLFSGLSDLDAMRAVRAAAVPRPRELEPSLPAELDELLLAALAPTPAARPSAGQLGAKLRSLRYALELAAGDPATELARLLDAAEGGVPGGPRATAPSSARPTAGTGDPDHLLDAVTEQGDATVIRIRTAEDFAGHDPQASIARARAVIDRFEEEETRMARLTGAQLRALRDDAPEPAAPAAPPRARPGSRSEPEERTRARRETDAPTVAVAMPPAAHGDEARTRPADPRARPTGAAAPSGGFPAEPPPTHPGTVHARHARAGTEPPAEPATPAPRGPIPRTSVMTPGPAPFARPPTAPPAPFPTPPPASFPTPPPASLPTPPPGAIPIGGAPPAPYPGWGGAPPASWPPPGAALGPGWAARPARAPRPALLRPGLIVAGAVVMAALAFVITRALLS